MAARKQYSLRYKGIKYGGYDKIDNYFNGGINQGAKHYINCTRAIYKDNSSFSDGGKN